MPGRLSPPTDLDPPLAADVRDVEPCAGLLVARAMVVLAILLGGTLVLVVAAKAAGVMP